MMETYPDLARPAGPYSRCACGAYGAVVHDNRVWCIACHVDSLFTPEKLIADAYAENCRRGTRLITHCPKGHAYDGINTAIRDGKRHCRACNRERWHRDKQNTAA